VSVNLSNKPLAIQKIKNSSIELKKKLSDSSNDSGIKEVNEISTIFSSAYKGAKST